LTVRRTTPHLTFIDGIRGLASLDVVFFHAVQDTKLNTVSPPFWYDWFAQGHTMVTIFIVVSGFCLMLPAAKNGFVLSSGFFRRRAYRILPPYYFALGLGSLAEFVILAERPALPRPQSTALALWSHVFMVHNLFPSVQYRFDGPLWSVAMECQIYLLFPIMVVAWRRFGPTPTLIVVGILAHAGYYLTGHKVTLNYFFIFALGMWGADLAVHGKQLRSIQWVSGASLVGYLALLPYNRVYVSDLFVGLFSAMLMAALALGAMAPVRNALSGRVVVWFGTFSYSIYLVHSIIQQVYLNTTFAASLDLHTRTLVMFVGVTPVVLITARIFYLVAEKPYITRRERA
jgi:peptidoglycan/LPS O-acetylase OafA/YrhL